MEAIIAALISAIASVVVALIGHRQQSTKTNAKTSALTGPYKPTITWIFPFFSLAMWLVLSATMIGYQLADINLFVIPVFTLLAAAIWPIKPLLASAFALLAYSIYYVMLPISFGIHHREYSDPVDFVYGAMSLFGWSLRIGLTTVTSVLAGFMCVWRVKHKQTADASLSGSTPETTPISDSAAGELERIIQLHGRGLLTDDEFAALKRRLFFDSSQKG